MIRLLLFKSQYEAQLKTDIKNGKVDAYYGETFPYDVKQTLPTTIEVEEDICEKMYGDVSHEFDDAVTLYNALRDVPEVMAADPTFWISLSHTIFFPFLKKRWGNGKNLQKNVLNHWFFQNGMVRHGLGGLWWTVRLTVENEAKDPYRLTKVAFWNYSFRTTFMGPSIFFRVTNARTGILKFLADHEELRSGMENKGLFISHYFNRLGATKQLAALPPEFFYEEMANNVDEMNAYRPKYREPYDSDEETDGGE